MAIGDVSSAATDALAKSQDKNASSSNKLAKDLDSFLQLLTSQLKNQDPLSPMDSTEFTNQLTQFAQVEQQINMNANLTNLIGLSQQSIVSNAVNYIGKTIEGESNQVPLQNGVMKAAYGLTDDAKSVSVVVRDDTGNIVFSKVGQTTKGVHEFTWDGKDANGLQLDDGVYSLSITSVGGDDKPVDNYVTAFGKVTGVTTINGTTVLLLDKVGIPVDKVLSISAADEPPAKPEEQQNAA
ncbi:MAG: flagellar hook assembly protein FlgD [Rhodospirillaceae bacterium]|nr:flagellar hook assembly protein FlgD [Rhodospirillaceae bacterium]